MTNEQLRLAIARHKGWRIVDHSVTRPGEWTGENDKGAFYLIPDYPVDIAAALSLVYEMERAGYWAQMRTPFGMGDNNDGYRCGFTPHLTSGWNGVPDYWTSADTLPRAICLAYIAVNKIDVESED